MNRIVLALLLMLTALVGTTRAGVMIVKAGSTSVILDDLNILDSTKTDGSGLAGLTSASGGLTCYYHRNTASSSVAVSLVSMTLGTYTSGGFLAADGTNMPGVYSFCPPNAALAAGATSVVFTFRGATGMAQVSKEVMLVAFDPQDVAALGLSNLDVVVSTRATPAQILSSPSNLLVTDSSGRVQVQYGTSTGQLSASAGVVQANVVQLDSAALGTHATGEMPSDLRYTAGTVLNAAAAVGYVPTDVLRWLGTAVGANVAGVPNVNSVYLGGINVSNNMLDAGNNLKAGVEMWRGSVPNALVSSRVDTSVGSYPGNTAQTGDAYAYLTGNLGTHGAQATALGDTRLAYLDAAVTSRVAAASLTGDPYAYLVANLGTHGAQVTSGLTLTSGERTSITAAIMAYSYDSSCPDPVLGPLTVADYFKFAGAATFGLSSGGSTQTPVLRAPDSTTGANGTARISGTVNDFQDRTARTLTR